jgi:ABC-type enterochelin transport system substrate-binding protein
MKKKFIVLLSVTLVLILFTACEKTVAENGTMTSSSSLTSTAAITTTQSETSAPKENAEFGIQDLTMDSLTIGDVDKKVEAKYGQPQSTNSYTEEATGNEFVDWQYNF